MSEIYTFMVVSSRLISSREPVLSTTWMNTVAENSSVEEAAHSTGTNRSGSRESRGMFRQSARWMETPRPRVM